MASGEARDSTRMLDKLDDLYITELSKHKIEWKTLATPFHPLEDQIVSASWTDQACPLYTGATPTIATTTRDEYLEVSREIAGRAKIRHDTGGGILLNRVSLKEPTDTQFDCVFAPLLDDRDGSLRSRHYRN